MLIGLNPDNVFSEIVKFKCRGEHYMSKTNLSLTYDNVKIPLYNIYLYYFRKIVFMLLWEIKKNHEIYH